MPFPCDACLFCEDLTLDFEWYPSVLFLNDKLHLSLIIANLNVQSQIKLAIVQQILCMPIFVKHVQSHFTILTTY